MSESMTGAELAKLRRAAGLSQTALGRRVGIGRHAVSYWEQKPKLDPYAHAVRCIAEVLDVPKPPPSRILTFTFPRVALPRWLVAEKVRLETMAAKLKECAAQRRVSCNAKTRKGTSCKMKSEPGKRRCKFHGGKSTGPRTPEGKARIVASNRLRWATWRRAREHALDADKSNDRSALIDAKL